MAPVKPKKYNKKNRLKKLKQNLSRALEMKKKKLQKLADGGGELQHHGRAEAWGSNKATVPYTYTYTPADTDSIRSKTKKNKDRETMESSTVPDPEHREPTESFSVDNFPTIYCGGKEANGVEQPVASTSSAVEELGGGDVAGGGDSPAIPKAAPAPAPAPALDDGLPSDCAVRGCRSSRLRTPLLLFFPLPNNERRCAHWVRVIGRPELALQEAGALHAQHSVCALHFLPHHLVGGQLGGQLAAHAVPMRSVPRPPPQAAPPPPDPTKARALRRRKPPARAPALVPTKTKGTQTDAAIEAPLCVQCARRAARRPPPAGRPLTPSRARRPPLPDDEDEESPTEEPLIDVGAPAAAPPTAVFVYEYRCSEPRPEPPPDQPLTVVVKLEPDDEDMPDEHEHCNRSATHQCQ